MHIVVFRNIFLCLILNKSLIVLFVMHVNLDACTFAFFFFHH
jgi:hypothetical protein